MRVLVLERKNIWGDLAIVLVDSQKHGAEMHAIRD
jgi:hypothetical protein